MEQRLANSVRVSINEKRFIENGLLSELRVDGRQLFDYRDFTIDLGREDGHAQVHLGHTRVMATVTSELVRPFRDRPNEGTLSIFTEFSPMADPSFEAGRPGELAVEMGRIIDRGLRESWALDVESLCIVAGRFVWAIRIDLLVLDNGGNLIDAANTAALAALLTFRRPDCSIEGVDAQEVVIHSPEEREPLPLIIHHLPIAVTFGIFNEGNNIAMDPTYLEEAVMVGRITVTLNSNGEICAIQKAGGEGIRLSAIALCLRTASTKAAEITVQIEKSVDLYNEARTQMQIKRHNSSLLLSSSYPTQGNATNIISLEHEIDELNCRMERWKAGFDMSPDVGFQSVSSQVKNSGAGQRKVGSSIGHPLSWDPYSNIISSDFLRKAMVAPGRSTAREEQVVVEGQKQKEITVEQSWGDQRKASSLGLGQSKSSPMSLRDAIKPKDRRRR